jgi:lipopolysaccharide/colanic/teichoic acid biosynthesis glycosyltransferase
LTWAAVQRALAFLALLTSLPALAICIVAIRVSSSGAALHRADRVSRGRPFKMLKLRSMGYGAERHGTGVTAAGDPRVTSIGRLLRRTKLDELPQLWNVVRGEMLLVGPRPEDPRYVDWSDPLHRLVFGARPGITGLTALAFRDEEGLLATEAARLAGQEGRGPGPDDVERAYREFILPRKVRMDAEYLTTRSVVGDVRIIGMTIGQVLGRTGGG